MDRSRLGALAVALASVGWSAHASASPEDLFGYGARTSAMGATGAAHAEGAESAFHNPALGSRVRRNALTIGMFGAAFALDPATNAAAAKGIVIGAAIPVPLGGRLHDRVGLTLALYTPTDVVVRGRVLYPEKPQFPLLADRAQSITLRGGIGVDIGGGFRAGAGVAALAALTGSVVATAEGSRVDDQLVATYAPTFGVTWERAAWRVGAVYRGELDARFAVTVDGSKLTSLPIPVFSISGLAQYDPAQVALEVARTTKKKVGEGTVAFQLVYKHWGAFPGLIEPTIVCSTGVRTCGLSAPAVDWQDTIAVRFGMEQGFALAPGVILRARMGGWLETSALPDSLPTSQAFDPVTKTIVAVPTRYFDGTRFVFTAGAGLRLRALDIDVFAQEHVVMSSGYITAFGLSGTVRF